MQRDTGEAKKLILWDLQPVIQPWSPETIGTQSCASNAGNLLLEMEGIRLFEMSEINSIQAIR